MAGAIAGTAILNIENHKEVLDTVTLTINNECNMQCRHCYLQYNSDKSIITDDVLNGLFANRFRHLVIVGKEPLVNDLSINKLCYIVEKCREIDSTISMVTNGINLVSLPTSILPLFDYIDVSFDGGIKSYANYRRGELSKIIDGIHFCLSHGLKEVNALHTICNQTIDNITDCISLNQEIPFKTILFTPYIVTHNQGNIFVSSIPLLEIIQHMDNNETFNNTDETMLLIDNYHIEQDKMSVFDLYKVLNNVKNKNKYRIFESDPLYYGIVRVTYDGLILSPRQSLHTACYHTVRSFIGQNNLNMVFHNLLKEEKESNGNKRIEF